MYLYNTNHIIGIITVFGIMLIPLLAMDASEFLLTLIKGSFITGGIVSLYFAYKVFIKKNRPGVADFERSRTNKFIKDAVAGTFFFFMGCSLFACTVAGIPHYLHKKIKAPKTKNSMPALNHAEFRGTKKVY